jgi:hypothetical protein
MQRLYQYLDREDVPTKLPDALAAAVVFWSVMDESLDDRTQRWIGGIFGDCTLRFLDLMAEDEEASELELLLLEDFLGKQPHIDRIETTAVDYDVSSFDIVRLVCLVGEWLWSHPIVFHDNDPDDLVRLLGSLAWTHLIASRASSIKFMGELIPVSQPIRPIVWSLFNVVASLRPPQGTLSFLLATGLPQFVEPKAPRSTTMIPSNLLMKWKRKPDGPGADLNSQTCKRELRQLRVWFKTALIIAILNQIRVASSISSACQTTTPLANRATIRCVFFTIWIRNWARRCCMPLRGTGG